MDKPKPLASLVAGVAVVASIAGGCGGSGGDEEGSNEENAAVSESQTENSVSEPDVPDELIERAAAYLEIDRDQLRISEPEVLAPSECRLVKVWDDESLEPGSLPYVVLGDGRVVDREDVTVGEVVDTCFTDAGIDAPDAAPMAEMVIAMDEPPGPLVIAGEGQGRRYEDAGAAFAVPTVSVADGVLTLQFFASDREFGDLYRVEAVRDADGGFAVAYETLV